MKLAQVFGRTKTTEFTEKKLLNLPQQPILKSKGRSPSPEKVNLKPVEIVIDG